MPALRFIPTEITLTKEQEKELFQEFAAPLTVMCAALVNISKEKSFTKFAFLAATVDRLFHEAHDQMCGLNDL